ncbi:MAG TPA: dienelactone hydrolase family protein, partial [Gracilimonas sp.]|uniref:dienelactone hydrolase family protein n=1 Tax=Gracilimonas sp. TaxID=1974203 RepID=UPI002D8FB169|nr:dienelactone hydrolase family protein [Gracilimonas sp.]
IRDEKDIELAKQNYIRHYEGMLKLLPESEKTGIPDIDAFVNKQADQLVAVYGSDQTKSLLFYDPTEDLKELNIPVLVLFGGKDTQVTEEMNRKPIENALETAGVSYEVEIFTDANHLFQQADSGNVSEYALLEKEFVDGFLKEITKWIKEN